jgi:hypothetical protein
MESKTIKIIIMFTQEQIEIMIASLEELQEELSINNHGDLFQEQYNLLEYLKTQLK